MKAMQATERGGYEAVRLARAAQPGEIANLTVFLALTQGQLHHRRGHRRRRRPHRRLTTATTPR